MSLPDPIIVSDPERLSGTPCFAATRVPVKTLFDYLAGGDTLDEFLADFPNVSRQHAVAVLHASEAAFVQCSLDRERYVATPEELAAIAEAEAELARGERVPKEQVDAFWRRHGL